MITNGIPEIAYSPDGGGAGGHPSALKGREEGLRDGFYEGYLRGRSKVIAGAPRPQFPARQVRVLYVGSGKGFPYSPIDEAVIATLRQMTAETIICEPGVPLAELAASTRPDLLLVLDGMDLPLEQVDAVRAGGTRTAVWLTDDPYYTDITMTMVPHYDYVFTLERNCIDLYRSLGCANVHYLPFAAYPEHYRPTVTQAPVRRTVGFIGSAYWNRVQFFQPIIGQLMNRGLTINGIWWDRLPEYPAYTDRIDLGKWMGPAETAEVYGSTKIIINLHRSPFEETANKNSAGITGVSPNPRTFEIAASGTLQLVDARGDLASFYTPGMEIETFTTAEELIGKIDFYLTHEKERQEIVFRALQRTYRDHMYSNRIDELLRVIFG
ncbi:glycosyltransferase [Paenibacillus sp. M1]|uniref:Glycosyltransferase n=1 Tax=Paenibacillus haidiansis TaxID=1574488 RepID=A0ABU7VXE0_9BACL